MRILYRYAHKGRTRRGRDRTAPVRALGLARTPFFSPRERAALGWTEALTNIQDGHASDAAYEEVRPAFDEHELAQLTLAIVTINAWNRIAIGFRTEPGSYQPAKHAEAPTTAPVS